MEVPFLNKEELLKKLNYRGIVLTPLLNKAFQQAQNTHQEQKRDDGSPCLEQHIYPLISDLVDSFKGQNCPEKLLIAGLLHDVLEDDDATTEAEFIRSFGQDVYDIVKPLTKERAENSPLLPEDRKREINAMMLEKISRAPKFSRLIKLADRTNNLASIITTKDVNPEKFKRYVIETKELYLPFAKKESDYYFNRLEQLLSEFSC
ncbi:MAG: HD domain-containing protein [Candidatus Pacebacteria bacterium]|nr:HD domain-containing protein [Candidatus Paceibacterota bacterium]